ncbi:hypothetical protein, partial [Streptomyces cyaneofuscatus]|uniref:hypothetical protein n=1 Tax=Streptomyces cyaneofuscatus TaxID=66883 RepID=UPI00364E6C36
MPEFISNGSIMSRRENPLEFERRNGPTAGKTSPADWGSGPKGSDRVGLAGKGKRESEDLESEKQQNRLTRFDRESDTKESDRVGNAGQQDKETRREAPGG